MEALYKKFCREEFDENGRISKLELFCDDNFNFGYDVVDAIADEEPDKVALVWCGVHGEEKIITFGEMKEMSNRAANVFRNNGIKKGDRVMLILKRHYEFWYALVGLHKLGAVVIPATHMLTTKDIVYRIQNVDVRGIVCTPDENMPEQVLEAQRCCPNLTSVFIVKENKVGMIQFNEELEKASPVLDRVDTKKTDYMLLYFTSGTSGDPKAVTHDFTYPIGHICTAKYWHNVVNDGVHLTVADTGWAKAAWGKIYGQWLCGSAIMVYDYDNFYANEMLKVIEKYKVTTFCAPPTLYKYLIRGKFEKHDLSSLKHVTTAGEALNPEILNIFREKTGLTIMEGFGQTESTLILANLVGDVEKPGSMGRPSPMYNVKLLNDDGEFVTKPNEEGEIVIIPDKGTKQIGLFAGYYNNDAQYDYVWRGNVYHTGDRATFDEDGYYWYVGRVDDIIKSSGYRIGPFEVESVLMEHPAVLDVAVTAVPSKKRGSLVKATIILHDEYEPIDELKVELQDFCKAKAASYKFPRVIEFVDSLPKTPSGKIKRNEIRKMDAKRVWE